LVFPQRTHGVGDYLGEDCIPLHQPVLVQEAVSQATGIVVGQVVGVGGAQGQRLLGLLTIPHLTQISIREETAALVQFNGARDILADQERVVRHGRRRIDILLHAGDAQRRGDRDVKDVAELGKVARRVGQTVGIDLEDRHLVLQQIQRDVGRSRRATAVRIPEIVVVDKIWADTAVIGVVAKARRLFGHHTGDAATLRHITTLEPRLRHVVAIAQIAAKVIGLRVPKVVVGAGVGDKTEDQVLAVHALRHRHQPRIGQDLAGGQRQPFVVAIAPAGATVGRRIERAVVVRGVGKGEKTRRAMPDIELEIDRIDVKIFGTPQSGALKISFPGAGFAIAVSAHKPAIQPVPHAIAFSRGGGGQIRRGAVDAQFPRSAVIGSDGIGLCDFVRAARPQGRLLLGISSLECAHQQKRGHRPNRKGACEDASPATPG